MAALNNITSPPDIAQDDSAVALKKVQNYLYSLQEQLRFMFSNLGVENINNTSLNELETLLTGGVKTQIQDAVDNITSLQLAADGLHLEVSNGNESSTITLKSGDTEISSQNINMEGVVTFSDLKNNDGTTVINGSNIKTGEISADIIKGGTISASKIDGVNINGASIYGGSIGSAIYFSSGQNADQTHLDGLEIQDGGIHFTRRLLGEETAINVGSLQFVDEESYIYMALSANNATYPLKLISMGKLDLTSNNHGIRVNYNGGNPLVVPIQYGVNDTDGITNKIDLGCGDYRFKGIYLNNAPNVFSDERGKTEINDIDAKQACAFVDALNVVSYLYKTDDDDHKKRIGLLAGKMREIDPAFADFFVDEDEKQMLSLRPSDLVFALIPKIQAQQKTIDELKDKVTTQQQTIADLFVNVEALKSRIALL